MRNLQILASDWRTCLPDQSFEMSAGEELLSLECCQHENWHYQRLAVSRSGESFYYLYAARADELWVLGVFDTAGQADLFLAMHNHNPLWVPGLLQTDRSEAVRIEVGVLDYPQYQGLYRVGFKSYQVEPDAVDPGLRVLTYVDKYNSQGLGVLPEKEACLAIYSHFDGRLRGCKMC